jgi:hypothetical protein
MQEYKIGPAALSAITKKSMIRVIPIMVIAVAIGLLVPQLGNKGASFDSSFLLIIPFFVLFLGFSLYRGLNKQKKLLASYRLTIEGNVITREQLNTEEITIYFHEIKEIIKTSPGTLTIKGFDKTDVIYVPVQIDNFDKLEAFLSELKPITLPDAAASRKQKLKPLLSLVVLGLMITVYVSFNKILVSAAALLFSAAVIWSIYEIRKSKNVDSRTKRGVWVYLLVLASVLGVAAFKIFTLEL